MGQRVCGSFPAPGGAPGLHGASWALHLEDRDSVVPGTGALTALACGSELQAAAPHRRAYWFSSPWWKHRRTPHLAEHLNSPRFLWVTGSFPHAVPFSSLRPESRVCERLTVWPAASAGKAGWSGGQARDTSGSQERTLVPFPLSQALAPWGIKEQRHCAVPAQPLRLTRYPVLRRSPVWAAHLRQQVGLGEPRQQPLHGGCHACVGGRAPHRLRLGAQARPQRHRYVLPKASWVLWTFPFWPRGPSGSLCRCASSFTADPRGCRGGAATGAGERPPGFS